MIKLRRLSIKNRLSLIIYCVIFLLFACNEDETDTVRYDGKNLNINLALPGPLAETIDGLQAYVTLNNGSRTALTVDTTDNTTRGQILDVNVGTYELALVYFKEVASIETILATFSTTITVSKDQTTTVTVADDELDRNIDDDGDGFTNLAEVRINTDPHDRFSTPGTPPGFAVAHGSYGAVSLSGNGYTVQSIVGETLTGSTETASTNYQATVGFTSY